MADGRRKHDWDQTALLGMLFHNAFAKDAVSPRHFHPFYQTRRTPKPIKGLDTGEILKALFVDRRPQG